MYDPAGIGGLCEHVKSYWKMFVHRRDLGPFFCNRNEDKEKTRKGRKGMVTIFDELKLFDLASVPPLLPQRLCGEKSKCYFLKPHWKQNSFVVRFSANKVRKGKTCNVRKGASALWINYCWLD